MHVFPSFSLDFIMGLEWDTMLYWNNRAIEIKTGKYIEENVTYEDGKIDSDSFEIKKKRLYERHAEIEKQAQGTISG